MELDVCALSNLHIQPCPERALTHAQRLTNNQLWFSRIHAKLTAVPYSQY
jgi:hypothetical protein